MGADILSRHILFLESSTAIQYESAHAQRPDKNRRIAQSRSSNLARHKMMICKTYELKVDASHLSIETTRVLRLLFLEAKWFYNDMLFRSRQEGGNIWTSDYKRTEVLAKSKDGEFESKSLTWLSAQMR